MKKLFIPVGDYLPTPGGIAICKEVSPNEDLCPGCIFAPSDYCDFLACCSHERPDGKNVIFIKERGMK